MSELQDRWNALRLFDRVYLTFLGVVIVLYVLVVVGTGTGHNLSEPMTMLGPIMFAAGLATALHCRETGLVLSGQTAWLLSLVFTQVTALLVLFFLATVVLPSPSFTARYGEIEFTRQFFFMQVFMLLAARLAVFVGTNSLPR